MISIAPFHRDMAEQASRLHTEIFHKRWTAETMKDYAARGDICSLVALEDNQVVGLILARKVKDEAEILTIFVAEELRQKGTGKELMTQCLSELSKQGIKHVFLEVATDNKSAILMYESLNFIQIGTRKDYYLTPNNIRKAAFNYRISLPTDCI